MATSNQWVGLAAKVALEVAAPNAASVDVEARFPAEAIGALKSHGLMGVLAPREMGGQSLSVSDLAEMCFVLGQHCSATAMVFAMHQIQVACLVRHGLHQPALRSYLEKLVKEQWLLASATSEAGVGGDARSSVCAVEQHGSGIALQKNATVISYGSHADGIVATARRTVDAPASDQVLVALEKKEYQLEQTGGWDTLGMRGTCSNGYWLRAKASPGCVFETGYPDISSRTMVPYSHIVWTSLWSGIATAAVSRARAFVRAEARKKPGTTPPGALRVAELVNWLQLLRSNVLQSIADYEQHQNSTDRITSMGFAIQMNNLKTGTSQLAAQIVQHAMLVCGIHGYKNDTPYSLGRQFRDIHSAALMVSNDRLLGTNASLLLVHKEG